MSKYEPLRDKKGRIIDCMHRNCWRPAVRVEYGQAKHREFKGQTHNCCAVHSRP